MMPVAIGQLGATPQSTASSKRITSIPEPNPVWLSVLLSADCMARTSGTQAPIAWAFDGQRAIFRNCLPEAVVVDPFAVRVGPGQELTITWDPGKTAYTVAVTAWDHLMYPRRRMLRPRRSAK